MISKNLENSSASKEEEITLYYQIYSYAISMFKTRPNSKECLEYYEDIYMDYNQNYVEVILFQTIN